MLYTDRLPVAGPGLDNFSFPAGQALLIVGDSHGQSTALRNMLDLMGRMVTPGKHRTLTFLGDFIDRGPDSLGCLTAGFLEGGDRANADTVVHLPGNHELMLANTLDALHNDTINTNDDGMNWMMNGGIEFLAELGDDAVSNPVDGLAMLEEKLVYGGQSYLDLVRAMPSHFRMGDVLCVHAGIDPKKSLATTFALGQKEHRVAHNHWAWVRTEFLEWQRGFSDDQGNGLLLVHGHTPPKGAVPRKLEHGDDVASVFSRMATNSRVCVDGGATGAVGVAGAVITEDGVRLLFSPC